MALRFSEKLAMVKLQSAFFEYFGPKGMEVAKLLADEFKKNNCLTMLDAKKSDISSSCFAYGKAYLGEGSYYKFDAMTLVPYFGFKEHLDLFDYARENNAILFLMVRSSTPNSQLIDLANNNGRTIYKTIAAEISDYNQANNGSFIGAVVGATIENYRETLEFLPNSLILSPGIGFQGGNIEELIKNRDILGKRIIPTLSRDIWNAGPDIEKIAARLDYYQQLSAQLF